MQDLERVRAALAANTSRPLYVATDDVDEFGLPIENWGINERLSLIKMATFMEHPSWLRSFVVTSAIFWRMLSTDIRPLWRASAAALRTVSRCISGATWRSVRWPKP